ncbi:hypothetical protein Cgig2_004783 [Carnegiea gigantea]|uniref:SecA Wing/Scaffold domain-containing protein n=1 Tax=Carnegiea gigantea TaxID=171969 RepID=A0A9Q1KSW5_9CARY|nr:hypothetical protein Cgig2_004783 [Carnegiea gigantea]
MSLSSTKLLALQMNVEKYFFNIRKSLVEFDEVLEVYACGISFCGLPSFNAISFSFQVQRKHVYDLRQLILAGDAESCSQHTFQYMQAVIDETVLANVDPHKHPSRWDLQKILKDFIRLGGKLLKSSFAEVTDTTLLNSFSKFDGSHPLDFNSILPPDFPRPPNVFRGIRRKTSSLMRWLTICADDSITDGRYRLIINYLRKYLGDFLIASYLHAIEESGFDDTYVKQIEVINKELQLLVMFHVTA